MGRVGRWLSALAVAGTGTVGAACSAAAPTPAPGAPALVPLHVQAAPPGDPDRTPVIADPAGRQVILRGVAAVGLQDTAYPGAGSDGPAIYPIDTAAYQGTCPVASPLAPQPPLCETQADRSEFAQSTAPGSGDDFAQMRQLGFDVVRLVLNWSQLEPTPGQYSSTYLARVDQVVGWAAQQGIYVILDLHQDQYSRFIVPASPAAAQAGGCTPAGGQDGAPAWAVDTDGKPACGLLGQASLNPASAAAFENFWENKPVAGPQGQAPGTGLEDHYIGALAALVQHYQHDPTVAGYELMNEPQPGSTGALPFENLYTASAEQLYPFYEKAIEAITGVRDHLPTCTGSDLMAPGCAYPDLAQTDQLVFFEPLAYRNIFDFSPQRSAPFTTYKNLVYAPHVYTHAFTVDVEVLGYTATDSPYPPSYDFGYQTAEAEAQAMHAAVFTTEFGDAASTDGTVLSGELAAQDDTETGGTVWAWKGLGTDESSCWCVRFQPDRYATTTDGTPGTGDPRVPPGPDTLIASRGRLLARAFPEATAGVLDAYGFDPSSGAFDLVATATSRVRPGQRGAETVVYVPPGDRGAVAVAGAAVLDTVVRRPDGSRLVYVAPRRAGGPAPYRVTVGPVPAALAAHVAADAEQPPAPIAEPAARQLLQQAVTAAAASSVPAVHAGGQLASELEPALLGPPSADPNLAP